MNTNVGPEIFRKRLIVEGKYAVEGIDVAFLEDFLRRLSQRLEMTITNGPHISSATGKALPVHDGFEGSLICREAEASTHIWTKFNFCTVDIYSYKSFDTNTAIDFIRDYFEIKNFSYFELPDPHVFTEDKRIEIRETDKGSGVFALDAIPAGTVLSYIDGQTYFVEKDADFSSRERKPLFHARDHIIPFHKRFYRNAFHSKATQYNHSCEPNCFVKDLFLITTIRDIQAGEELAHSYSLICNANWNVPVEICLCKSENCLGVILQWKDLPKEYKIKYLPYTADWILFEEMKKNGAMEQLKEAIRDSE